MFNQQMNALKRPPDLMSMSLVPLQTPSAADFQPGLSVSKRSATDESGQTGEKKKKKRSRWGTETQERLVVSGMPTTLPSDLPPEKQKQYILQVQIEEMNRKLRTGELGIPDNPEDRSPSPEPVYDHIGKRMNTREFRTRRKVEDERHQRIHELLKIMPEYKPPFDYKPPPPPMG